MIVANPQGAAGVSPEQLHRWQAYVQAEHHARTVTAADWEQWRQQLSAAPQALRPSVAFTKAAAPHPAPPGVGVDLAAFVASLPTQRPLRFDSAQLIYTDGSKQGSAIGAGVYDGRRRRPVGVMPRGHAGQLNTVPKAEGTGILAALQAVPDGEDVTLLTDSLTLIHMLRSVLHTPTSYRVHKHKHMLKRVVNAMLSRQGATTIYKVRAHIGVRGNELADTAAGIAAAAQHADDTTEAEEQLRRANPAPDGTTALVTHTDEVAGAPGIASSWLQYPVEDQGAPGGEPALWDFDELRRQVTRWIKRVWSD